MVPSREKDIKLEKHLDKHKERFDEQRKEKHESLVQLMAISEVFEVCIVVLR